MGVNSFTQLHTLLRLVRHQRMTLLQTCTLHLLPTTSGWEDQISMRRETGPGLTERHSATQSGTVVRVQVALHRIALLWTLITPHPTMDTGMTLNALTHIPIFVKSTLIT